MLISKITSTFSLKIQALSGLHSELQVSFDAHPDAGSVWDLEGARRAHLDLAEIVVKETFTALTVQGSLDPKETKMWLVKATDRFQVIRSKRSVKYQETSEVINAF